MTTSPFDERIGSRLGGALTGHAPVYANRRTLDAATADAMLIERPPTAPRGGAWHLRTG
jgi:hypothetical protein